MNFKTFIIGWLILILAPILVIGGFYLYTHWSNARPQSGLLHTHVAPQIAFTGDPLTYTIHFLGNKAPRPKGKPAPPVDMIFVVDISRSMHSSLPDMIEAARTVTNELVTAYPSGHVRFALTQFHDSSEIKSDWTSDPNALYTGLSHLDKGSNNKGTALAFPPIHQLFSQARPNATKTVVFYTDGHIGVDDSIIKKAEALRRQGIKIFSISPPGYDEQAMLGITGDWDRVLEPMSLQDIIKKFRQVTDVIMGLYGYNAQLTHLIDKHNFSAPIEKTEWRKDKGKLQRNIGYLPLKRSTYEHTLIPETIGLWTIGLAPPKITFISITKQAKPLKYERRPQVLVISVWLLILMFLPALLWLLAYLKRHKPIAVPADVPPTIRSLTQPSPLPLPPFVPLKRKTVVPTLFIGLGGTGRQALYATQEQLNAAHFDAGNVPYRFLWLDVDINEINKPLPFINTNAMPSVQEVIAPLSIRQMAQYLPAANQPVPSHLSWFNPQHYLDVSRAELDLSKGSKGQRRLARLALFQWLKEGSLLTLLKEEYQQLLKFASVDERRQIILFADRTGGVGNGWLIDIARLLRRIARQEQQNQQTVIIPDIIASLSSPPDYQQQTQQQQNRYALDKEIETAQLSGAFPQQIIYQPNETLLDEIDSEAPFNNFFAFNIFESERVATQAAILNAILVERYPRYTLLNHNLHQGQIVSTQVRGLHVMPDLNYQLVKLEILLCLLGAEVLLDLEQDEASQKLTIRSIEQTEKYLKQWSISETQGTPWQLLLNATMGAEACTSFFEIMAEKGHPDWVWFQQSFIVSLTRQLRGQRVNGRWVRLWKPSEAIAVLTLWTERLEQQVKPQALSDELKTILTQLIALANQVIINLKQWLNDFIPLCETISQQHSQLLQQRTAIQNREDQVFIDQAVDHQHIVQWTEQALQQWVGSEDVVSALCERFFFNARIEKQGIIISLAVYVEEQQEFLSAKEAMSCFDSYADIAARQIPTLKIEGALAELELQPLQQLARSLIDSHYTAKQVLMVMPTVTLYESTSIVKTLDDFKAAVVVPAGQAPVNYCYGDDHSAIRRLELQTEISPDISNSDTLAFTQTAEQIAEIRRQQAIHHFQIDVPIFPPALRIALSQPESFRSFSRAYKMGYIIKDETITDERGIVQWVFGEQKQFLTFGEANSLTDAAANYVFMMQAPTMIFDQNKILGDFSALEIWQTVGGVPQDEDIFVLMAMQLED